MGTTKVFVLGHEILRIERTPDADKTLGEAMAELLDDDQPSINDYEDPPMIDSSWDGYGREAGDDEHLVFEPDLLHEHVGEEEDVD